MRSATYREEEESIYAYVYTHPVHTGSVIAPFKQPVSHSSTSNAYVMIKKKMQNIRFLFTRSSDLFQCQQSIVRSRDDRMNFLVTHYCVMHHQFTGLNSTPSQIIQQYNNGPRETANPPSWIHALISPPESKT